MCSSHCEICRSNRGRMDEPKTTPRPSACTSPRTSAPTDARGFPLTWNHLESGFVRTCSTVHVSSASFAKYATVVLHCSFSADVAATSAAFSASVNRAFTDFSSLAWASLTSSTRALITTSSRPAVLLLSNKTLIPSDSGTRTHRGGFPWGGFERASQVLSSTSYHQALYM